MASLSLTKRSSFVTKAEPQEDDLISAIKGQIDLEGFDYSQWQRTAKPQPTKQFSFSKKSTAAKPGYEVVLGHRPCSKASHVSRPQTTASQRSGLDLQSQEKLKILRLRIKARKQTIADYIRRQKNLLEHNLELKREIEDTEEKSHGQVKQFLRKYEKFRGGIATLNDKFSRELNAARGELQESADYVCRHVEQLDSEVAEADQRLREKQSELRVLNNYKDKEYPVKAINISDLKREIEMLKISNKEEQEELEHIIETELGKFEKDRQLVRRTMIESVTQDAWKRVHPSLKDMSLQNMVMRKEMEVQAREVEDLTQVLLGLEREVATLLSNPKTNARKHLYPELFPCQEKCTPDMDVVLDIPTHDWLPI